SSQYVLNKSEKYIIQSKKFDIFAKLNFADQFKLSNLKNYCLLALHRRRNKMMESTPNVPKTSAEMLAEFAPVKPNPTDVTKFVSHGMGNVTLVFGDNKLRVSKEVRSNSPISSVVPSMFDVPILYIFKLSNIYSVSG
ncbi:hypothetical protein PMAYCL1PPCAC_25418, partial [Pristionchus mayeri]